MLFTFARHDATLHHDYVNIMDDLSGTTPGEAQVRGVLGYLGKAFKYSPARLVQLGFLVSPMPRSKPPRWSDCGSPSGGPST